MNWNIVLRRLCISDSASHNGIIVTRIANNRFQVVDGYGVTCIGGKNYSVRLAIIETINYLVGQQYPLPCARCDQRREVSSYCRWHYNAIHAQNNRAFRQRQKRK